MGLWTSIRNAQNKRETKTFIICGGRRTGTTLLASILCSNPGANPLGQEAQILTRIVESYSWSIDNYQKFGRSFFEDKPSLTALFQNSVRSFIKQASDYASPGNILVLKNPELAKVLERLYELLPDATYFITIRDPRDQISAELQVIARRRVLEKMDQNSSGRNIKPLIALYKSYLKEILDNKSKPKKGALIIRYEDLIEDWSNTLRRLETAAGVKFPFDPKGRWPRVSKHAGLKSESPSSSILYGEALSSSSIGRYKHDLKKEEILLVEKEFQEFIEEYGY